MTDNTTTNLDMDLVEQQLRDMKPEELSEVAKRVHVVSQDRSKPSGPNLARMSDHEFRDFVSKNCGYSSGV